MHIMLRSWYCILTHHSRQNHNNNILLSLILFYFYDRDLSTSSSGFSTPNKARLLMTKCSATVSYVQIPPTSLGSPGTQVIAEIFRAPPYEQVWIEYSQTRYLGRPHEVGSTVYHLCYWMNNCYLSVTEYLMCIFFTPSSAFQGLLDE